MMRRISLCLVVCVCVASSSSVLAKQYLVKEGDTISEILARSIPTETELKLANPTKKDWPHLHVGEPLEIPFLSSIEAQSIESKNAELETETASLEESITVLIRERDDARAQSGDWQRKYKVAEPLAAAASFRQTLYWIFLAISLVLAILFALVCVYSLDTRKKFTARIEMLEKEKLALEGDSTGWRRIYAKGQQYLSLLSQLSDEDRADLLTLFKDLYGLPSNEIRDAVMKFVAERTRVTREGLSRPRLVTLKKPADHK